MPPGCTAGKGNAEEPPVLRLYSYYRSSASYRVRLALNLKGIDYRQQPVNLPAGEQGAESYLAVNAQGMVPALELPDGAVLTQSMAILEWLEEQYPRPSLYPSGAVARARARSLAGIIACEIHPLNNLRVLRYLKHTLAISEEQRTGWYHHWIKQSFAVIEAELTPGPYAFGDAVSVVDVLLIPQVYNALRFELDIQAWPRILSVYRACGQLRAFQSAAPEAQSDYPA